jgi:glycosyltransferase involved in cell wall biosynthesis
LLSLARYIDRTRFDHTLVTVNPPDLRRDQAAEMLRRFEESGLEVHSLDGEFPRGGSLAGKASRLVHRARALSEWVRRFEIDVIDAHLRSASLIGVAAGVMTGKPTAVTLYQARPVQCKPYWWAAQQFILSNADLVITDSYVRGQEIRRASVLRRPQVKVIPNGVAPLETRRSPQEMRRALSIPEDSPARTIGQISRLVGFKGQHVLLEAARLVLRIVPEAFFLIVGYERDEPGFEERLVRQARDLGIASRVKITGYPGPIADVWSVIDIHVHASLYDSLPNAILEGMSLGKPAVVTSVGGIPDAVQDGESGIVVPPGDPEALATALLRFLQNPWYARRCGEAAFRRYTHRYRAETTARALEACFLEIMRSNAEPSFTS